MCLVYPSTWTGSRVASRTEYCSVNFLITLHLVSTMGDAAIHALAGAAGGCVSMVSFYCSLGALLTNRQAVT